jgi:predicted dithiol-disulfide oxidoreductase (DUF899 family)
MFGPDETVGCTGCSFTADHFDGAIPHVQARDTTLLCVSRGPLESLNAYRERMGWKFDWVSSEGSDFNFDFGVSATEERPSTGAYGFQEISWIGEAPALSAFALEDGVVYHTYATYARGVEAFDGAYHLIDSTPKGRQEDGGADHPGSWWRRHDEYEGAIA